MSRILIVFGTKVDEVLENCKDCLMRDGEMGYCIITGDDVFHNMRGANGFPKSCPLPEVPDNPNKKESNPT